MTTALITGGAGFIGSHTAEALVKEGYNVIIVDNFTTGNRNNLSAIEDRVTIIDCDVIDKNKIDEVFNNNKIDYVFLYSAIVGVKRTLKNPTKVLQDIDGIKNILNLCITHKIKRLFYSSSSEVYGEHMNGDLSEEKTPLNSKLPYAIVKNLGEVLIQSYKKDHDLNYTIFRFFNTFGPRQSQDFVISNFIKKALHNETIEINGTGNQTRTFLFIEDNIKAVIKTLKKNLCLNETVNIGGEEEISINDLANLIIDIAQSNSKIEHKDALKEGDMQRRKPNISKMMNSLSIENLTTLKVGIKKTVEYMKNEDTITSNKN